MKVFLIFAVTSLAAVITAKLNERFAWKQVEYNWPSTAARRLALESGEYIVENNLPLGLERWHNKLFITVPRWKSGVASSLNYVDLKSNEESPKLIPYPSWAANHIKTRNCGNNCTINNNSTIVSTFRIQADNCDRLWVVDTGLVDILGAANQVTENAIVIFDLNTNRLIRRFIIPRSQIKSDTFFANIVVDSDPSVCSDAYAYIPDFAAYGLVIYSLRDNESYRVEHNFFHMDPMSGNFFVDGINFRWNDGLFGIAIGPTKRDLSRDIYFHAFASTKEFKVSNRILQNQTLATSTDSYYDFKYVGDRGRNGQSSAQAYDSKTGVIFYTLPNKNAIGCWNIRKPLLRLTQGIVDSDPNTLVFPNDLKIDSQGTIWVLSDKMSTFVLGQLDPTVVNYRVLMGSTKRLVNFTPCW